MVEKKVPPIKRGLFSLEESEEKKKRWGIRAYLQKEDNKRSKKNRGKGLHTNSDELTIQEHEGF